MVEEPLPLAARVHAGLARALVWVWPRGAAWALADAIAHAPRHAELRFLHGDALARARRWPEAARSLAVACRLRPASVEYQGALVVALDRARRDRELVEALRRLADLRPGEGEVRVLLGAVLRRGGRTAEALREYRLSVRLSALPAVRRFALGEVVLGADGWREALASWNEARQIEAASGSVILRNAGRRSALNFHPGRPLDRVPRRPPAPEKPARLAWLRAGRERLRRAVLLVARGEWRPLGPPDRVSALRRAWKRAQPRRAVRRAALLLALAAAPAARAVAALEPPAPSRGETPAAREQARLCERENREAGAAACRAALALGIGPARRDAVREKLARHLVALERWDELGELLRENVALHPTSAEAWQRLGTVLLFALDQPVEATSALAEASRLAPADASIRLSLALAHHAGGRTDEAAAAFEEALRLDPAVLEGRPAARAILEAVRRGEPWP